MIMETLEHHEQKLSDLNDLYFEHLTKVEERFKNGELNEAVKLAFDFLEKSTTDMRERAFREYKNAASKGLSFKERQGLVNWKKVRWCDEELKRLAGLRRSHKIKPFREWMNPEDYNWIKNAGLREFVRMNLAMIVEPSEKT